MYPTKHKPHLQQETFRLTLLGAFIIICCLILILRLGYLQFSQYKRFATLSLKNQMSILPIAPPRGIILDRNGEVLAENRPVYVLEIVPERVKNPQETLARLQALLPSITADDIDQYWRQRRQHHAYTPIPIKMKLTQDDVATFASHQYQFPGINIKAQLMRFYPLGEMTAHVVGYVGRINIAELKQLNVSNYQATNFVGKTGIERYYENRLHGQVGYQQIETDVSGRSLRILNKQAPVSGEKLYLSLDARLQKKAYEALGDNPGAVVVMSVENGEILALASAPSFDPNLFVNGINQHDYQELSNAPNRPLYNRAVRGLYPPASTVKPFVALAGLDKDVITTNNRIYDPGWYKLPGVSHSYRDWKRGGHGMMNVERAIMVSCDTFFYQLGNKIGIVALAEHFMQFGFGQLSHVDLYEETAGLVPNPTWKRHAKGLPWYPGDTLITSIGQGFMLATPLQLASGAATIGTHGQRYRPHLLAYTLDDQDNRNPLPIIEESPVKLKNQGNWDIVINAMQSVINNDEGTGYRFGRHAPYSVAGKTGTAQVFSLSQNDKQKHQEIAWALRDHSLFIAFAPVENPQIAIATLVEHDVIAAKVARDVMDAYFQLKKETPTS